MHFLLQIVLKDRVRPHLWEKHCTGITLDLYVDAKIVMTFQ